MDIKAQVFDHVLKRNYFLAKRAYGAWYSMKLRQKQLVIVFQMGKVGSTGLVSSLQAAALKMPVLQVHALTQQGINALEKLYFGDKLSIFQESLLPETKHLLLSHYLRKALHSKCDEYEWKLITLVRDPVARNVSEFFYSVDTNKHKPYLPDFYDRHAANTITTEELIRRFQDVFHVDSPEFQLPLRWFDRELAAVTGIDVYASQFPKEKGYVRHRAGGFDVLLLKLEHLGRCSRKAIKEFLGLPDFHLLEANLASRKRYYPVYKDFIQSISLPDSYLSRADCSKYARHFYSDEEIESFRKKWGESSESAHISSR